MPSRVKPRTSAKEWSGNLPQGKTATHDSVSGGFTQKPACLELNSSGHLYGSWLADHSIPRAERRGRGVANISVEGRIASEVLALVIDKEMGVEGIEEVGAELEGHSFSDPRVLRQREVQFLEVGPTEIADAAPIARIA